MSQHARPLALILLTGSAALLGSPAVAFSGGPQLPTGFIAEPIGTGWVAPTGLAYIDDSRLLVCEKSGRVWLVANDVKKNLVLDLGLEALNNGDRGILGIAIDPSFETNGY